MEIINLIQRFKSLPVKSRNLLRLGVILGLVVALPLFIWGITTQRFDLRKRAASGEPGNQLLPFLGNSDAPFKVFFININNAPYFNDIVDGAIQTKFNTIQPYKGNFYLTAFYKTSIEVSPVSDYCKEGSIEMSSGFSCDKDKIFPIIKGEYPNFEPKDFINIAFVETAYGGAASELITVGVYPNIPKEDVVASSSRTIIHEVSHLFGLMDYAIGIIKYDGSPNSYWDKEYLKKYYNLDSPGCRKWCKSYKPASQYNQSVSSACLHFIDKSTCLTFNRTDPNNYCSGGNCCVWSDTPFDYFNSKCVPWKGSENIGLQCLSETGCYFGGAYSHYVWRPVLPQGESVMLSGDGELDNISKKHVESVFRCCMNSNYSSDLTTGLNCTDFKADYESFLFHYGIIQKIGSCRGDIALPIITPTPTPTPSPSPTPRPGCGTTCQSSTECPTGLTCYQPPMPICPPGTFCTQVMPPKICRQPSCPSETNCICSTPTPKPTPINNSINWDTGNVTLSATNFYINIDRRNLFVGNPQLKVRSDFGNNSYTTLEATWQENNVEMRLYIYFNKDTSGNWNAYEIRTYNGQYPGDWLYYGALQGRPIGTPFTQDNVNLYSTDGRGLIHFEYLNLLPFTSTSNGSKQTMAFQVNFGGVADNSANGAKILIRFRSNDGQVDKQITPAVPVVWKDVSNAYEATLELTSNFLPWDKTYSIYIKGEKHLSTKFCVQNGQSERCTGNGEIKLPDPESNSHYIYSFAHFPLVPGDLPVQDGLANSNDFEKIKTLLAKSCSDQTDADKITADLDYNGCVNIRDAFLMRQTLETRYDEN